VTKPPLFLFLALAMPAVAASARPGEAAAGERPNILWITVEDIGPHLGSFGDTYAVTPRLDALAAEGVRYLRAFAPIGVCAPARSSLILGAYAPTAGSHDMRSGVRLPAAVKLYPQLLRAAGYYATNNAKQDYNLLEVPGDTWDESSRTAHWRNRPDPGQPFFAVFNLETTHESRIRYPEDRFAELTAALGPGERHDPALADVPPYHPDTPEVRRDLARYADLITAMDRQVGALLDQLEEDGLAGDTIVFFYSDHGAGLPRSKRWLYESSTRVPLIVRVPERFRRLAPGSSPGGVTKRLVDFTDLGPTALSLAGVEPPETMQGRAFLGEHARAPREYVYGFRGRMDERFDMQRAVRDERYRYIRSYMPWKIYGQHVDYMYEMPTMRVWWQRHERGELRGPERRFFQQKAPEELYDTWADPWEIHDLAGDPEYRDVLERLRGELRRWMLEIHDAGFLPEGEMHLRAEGSTPWELVRDPARYDLPRLIEAAERASRGAGETELLERLGDGDGAVRYWAASGLIGREALSSAARAALVAALDDAAPEVAITAAEALAAHGEPGLGLAALERGLRHPLPPVRLRAATVLDGLGEAARPALPAMREALQTWLAEDPPSWRRADLPKVLEPILARLAP